MSGKGSGWPHQAASPDLALDVELRWPRLLGEQGDLVAGSLADQPPKQRRARLELNPMAVWRRMSPCSPPLAQAAACRHAHTCARPDRATWVAGITTSPTTCSSTIEQLHQATSSRNSHHNASELTRSSTSSLDSHPMTVAQPDPPYPMASLADLGTLQGLGLLECISRPREHMSSLGVGLARRGGEVRSCRRGALCSALRSGRYRHPRRHQPDCSDMAVAERAGRACPSTSCRAGVSESR